MFPHPALGGGHIIDRSAPVVVVLCRLCTCSCRVGGHVGLKSYNLCPMGGVCGCMSQLPQQCCSLLITMLQPHNHVAASQPCRMPPQPIGSGCNMIMRRLQQACNMVMTVVDYCTGTIIYHCHNHVACLLQPPHNHVAARPYRPFMVMNGPPIAGGYFIYL